MAVWRGTCCNWMCHNDNLNYTSHTFYDTRSISDNGSKVLILDTHNQRDPWQSRKHNSTGFHCGFATVEKRWVMQPIPLGLQRDYESDIRSKDLAESKAGKFSMRYCWWTKSCMEAFVQQHYGGVFWSVWDWINHAKWQGQTSIGQYGILKSETV